MKIVLTNDDGGDAPGIAALREAAEGLGEVVVVAPQRELSGCGHQVTTHAPILVRRVAADRWDVAGTPGDCVRLALRELHTDADLVLSGINAGGNLGVDVYISGTVAAAREAAILGVPAMAVSQYRRRDIPVDWPRATQWARRVIADLLGRKSGSAGPPLWNINLPCLPPQAAEPEVVHCELDTGALDVRYLEHGDQNSPSVENTSEYIYAGVYDRRARAPGRDVDVCLGGRISVTALGL